MGKVDGWIETVLGFVGEMKEKVRYYSIPILVWILGRIGKEATGNPPVQIFRILVPLFCCIQPVKTLAQLSVCSTIILKLTIFTKNENLSIACQL